MPDSSQDFLMFAMYWRNGLSRRIWSRGLNAFAENQSAGGTVFRAAMRGQTKSATASSSIAAKIDVKYCPSVHSYEAAVSVGQPDRPQREELAGLRKSK